MATEVTRRAALSGYRTLLRTVTRVFGADEQAVREGRAQVREQFRLHADERDPKKIGACRSRSVALQSLANRL